MRKNKILFLARTTEDEGIKQKGVKKMRKFIFGFIAVLFCSGFAMADYYKEKLKTCDSNEMRKALNRATAENRATVTIIECEEETETETVTVKTQEDYNQRPVVVNNNYSSCDGGCLQPKEAVVNREYFVRETVQQYKPVVKYVPAGTYTRVRPACNHGC